MNTSGAGQRVLASPLTLLLRSKMVTCRRTDRQEEMTPTWQSWRSGIHSRTDHRQVSVQLPIIEGTQLHLYRLCSPCNSTREPKERHQSLPCRMGIGRRKVAVTGPHHQIG